MFSVFVTVVQLQFIHQYQIPFQLTKCRRMFSEIILAQMSRIIFFHLSKQFLLRRKAVQKTSADVDSTVYVDKLII